MAYQIIITKKFEKSAVKTSHWLEKEWSLKSAIDFDEKLKKIITELSINPNIGRISKKKNIRSFRVTKHNRIYYKIFKNQIIILDLFESKQNPKRNKFE
jgi:plasmid stabilization system protein ParE